MREGELPRLLSERILIVSWLVKAVCRVGSARR